MALLTIAHVASASAQQSGGNLIAVPVPAGVQQYDLLLAAVTHQGTLADLATPNGWKLLAAAQDSAPQLTAVYWRWAPASAPTSYTWTRPTSGKWVATMSAYRNVSWVAPFRSTVTLDAPGTASSWALSPLPFTGASTGLRRFDAVAQRSSTPATAWTPPAGMTLRESRFTTGSGASYIAVGDRPAASSSPDPGGTWSNNGSATAAAAFVSTLLSPRDSAETPPVPTISPSNLSLWIGGAEVPVAPYLWIGGVEVPVTAESFL